MIDCRALFSCREVPYNPARTPEAATATDFSSTNYSHEEEVLTIKLGLLRSTDDGITSNLETFVAVISLLIYPYGFDPLFSN
jgi:hypothetical protein